MSQFNRTTILPTRRLPAGDSGTLSFTLLNQYGQALTLGQIDAFLLTLWDEMSGEAGIINGRRDQDVLNANQVTVGANGDVAWTWLPADMPTLHPERPVAYEIHVAKFVATWSNGDGRHTFFQTFELERTGL